MSANRPAESDRGPVDFPQGVRSATACPVAFPACISMRAPWLQTPGHCLPFCAPICPRCRLIVQWRPTGRGGGAISRPVVRVPIRHCASPVAPPDCFVTFWACHRSLWEWHLRPASCPLPLRAPAGDLTPITSVKGTYSGEIKSLDRDPGIVSLNPGMQFPGN